jgi:predicted metal-dependent peptidase
MPNLSPAEVEQKILKARIALSLRQPFLASAIMRLPIKNATSFAWCKTMSTDGYHIFFNATWAENLSQSELRGVLAHEVLHVIFQHSSRRSNREPLRWNIAADHAINLILLDQGFVLPKNGFANNAYKGKSAEEIYTLLPESSKYRISSTGSLGGKEESDIGGQIPDVGEDILDPDNISVKAARSADMPDRAQLDELCTDLRNDAASKLQGNSAGLFLSECQAIEESRIDWRELLRSWLVDRIKNDWSMWPYSKKFIHRGLFMPSVGIEAPGHIIFAIDTSGSISNKDLGEIFSEIRSYRELFPCRLTVIQCDAKIRSIETFEELDGTEIPEQMNVFGRGGTDFRPVFDWAIENDPSSLLIYATDGFGSFPQFEVPNEVIWLLTRRHVDTSHFPFGSCVKISS